MVSFLGSWQGRNSIRDSLVGTQDTCAGSGFGVRGHLLSEGAEEKAGDSQSDWGCLWRMQRLPGGARAFEDAIHGKLARHLFILEKSGGGRPLTPLPGRGDREGEGQPG